MKIACSPFDEIHRGNRHFILELNKLWKDRLSETCSIPEGDFPDLCSSEADPFSDLYIAADTHHLIPMHVLNEDSKEKTFVLHKGLILFHLTTHSDDQTFEYPKPGSFFATTPAHSLHILFQERPDRVIEKGHVARLITYKLKRDILVLDTAGDNTYCKAEVNLGLISNKRAYKTPASGVVAGYYSNARGAGMNLNEIFLCAGPNENNLIFLEEIEITSGQIQKLQVGRLSAIGEIFNQTINTKICPSKLLAEDWLVVTNGYGLMFLYKYLEGFWSDDDRLLLFHSKANVYVEDDTNSTPLPRSVVITVPIRSKVEGRAISPIRSKVGEKTGNGVSLLYCKAWTILDVPRLWPLLKMLTETISDLRSHYLKSYRYDKLVLDDILIAQLTDSGIDLAEYL